jgi:hypothetical protein
VRVGARRVGDGQVARHEPVRQNACMRAAHKK